MTPDHEAAKKWAREIAALKQRVAELERELEAALKAKGRTKS